MLKKKIIKRVVLIIIGFIISACCNYCNAETETRFVDTYRTDVFSASHEYGGIGLQYVDYFNYEKSEPEAMFFCNRLGFPPILVNRTEEGTTIGSPDVSRVKTTDKQDTINPQLAYAMSIGMLPKNFPEGSQESWDYLQVLIWDAHPDVEGGADGILASDARSSSQLRANTQIEVKRFREVYEQIFEKTIMKNKPLFKIENKQSSLFVDQNDGTYIYGPFQLKVNCNASKGVVDNLIREIMQEGHEEYIDYDDNDFEKSEAYIENFFKFHKSIDDNFIANNISNGNKKNLKYSINPDSKDDRAYSTIIVDNMGMPIDFPKINGETDEDRNFFIKFNPYNDGAIINLGKGEETELFNLKVKYGSYLNYKEHIQSCVLYTKGVYGYIEPGADDQLIKPDCLIGYWADKGYKIKWVRLRPDDNSNRRIGWIGYLLALYAPKQLGLYIVNSSGGASFVTNDHFDLSHTYSSSDLTQSKFALNNYYPELHCVGWSTTEDTSRGARIDIPFGFAGDTDVEINKGVAAVKKDYALPLTQPMNLIGFRGIVRESATAKYSAHGTKTVTVTDKAAYTDAQGVYHPAETHDKEETDDWSTTKTIYRYRFASLTPEEITTYAGQNKITTSRAPESTDSLSTIDATQKDYTPPSAPSNSYSYGAVSETLQTGWTIEKIYGGRENGKTATEGFIYETSNTGWNYDRHFLTYSQRLELDKIILGYGLEYEYQMGDGQSGLADTQYIIRIPRDFDNPPNIGSYHDAQGWQADQNAYNEVKGALQSFISFEGDKEDDVFKYGTKTAIEHVALPHLKIAEAFGGNIWKEATGVKGMQEKAYDGIYNPDAEESYQGVKVDLYECNIEYNDPYTGPIDERQIDAKGEYLTSTFTDSKGEYRFYGKIGENIPLINPLKKYYVKFVYNGQIYAQTLYNVELNSEYGEYKDRTSKGLDEYRMEFNKRFENIYTDSNNYTYTGPRYTGFNGTTREEQTNYTYTGRAYGLKHVVQEALNDPNFNADLDTFEEQYNLFIKNNTHEDIRTTTEEYEFKNPKPGSDELNHPIIYGTGEITASNIDDDWENPIKTPIDYNYEGLAESVKRYLQDCMIEASVPYTPDLLVYGKNIGSTDLHKKFPEQETFNLKDMNRTYMDGYRQWRLTGKAKRFKKEDVKPGETVREIPTPAIIKKYIGDAKYEEGAVFTLFDFKGQERWHIVGKRIGEAQDIKLASLNDCYDIDFNDTEIKVAGQPDFDLDEPDPGTDPGPGPGPTQEYVTLWVVEWVDESVGEVHDIDNIYVPPEEHYINLYNKKFDLRHCWSFGVYQRNFNEVQLEKDLYKATMVVNGKKEVYSYSGKLPNEDGDQYNFEVDELINLNKPVNGGTPYTRKVRKSDYLYDENVAYGDGKYSKNIKAYLTYKIKVHNASPYTIRINEIADYYDADNLEFDGVRDASGRYEIATHTQNIDGQITQSKYTYASNLRDTAGHDVNKEYIGIYDNSAYTNGDNTKIKEEFKIANDGQDNNGQPYNLKTLYIRGNGAEGIPVVSKKGDVETVTNQLLPSQSTILFVTFKVKNNTIDNRISTFTNQIKLDQITRDFADKLPTIGKNNFAEINSYASYYTAEMPGDAAVEEKQYYRPYGEGKIRYGNGTATYLNMNDEEVGTEENPDICIAGVVDVYSNPGSFTERDVEVVRTDDGEYKELRFKDNSYRKITRPEGMPKLNKDDAAEESLPTVEPDMDKAPSIRIILDDDQIRKISGYVFEDEKTVNSDGSPIGNGKMDDGETRINGVTVQLVELIQDVDYDGTFTGQYIGEKVWDECEYTGLSDVKYQLKAGSENQGAQYYSGKGTKYILNSTSNLAKIYSDPSVANETTEDGKYCFAGLPSGDFIVRFIYGDTDRTVLTNGTDNNDSEKEEAVRETAAVNALTGRAGMNVKSYNGQDFKSTVYQRDLASGSQVNQDAISYKMKGSNEVKGYVDTLNQDYASMYNYNNNQLRAKEQLYDSNIIYYAGQPINNSGDLAPSQNAKNSDPRSNIANSYGSMWRYDRVATEGNKDLSDVNDLYGYRQRGIDYAQGYATGVNEATKTLLNYRAEVLSSFERLTSQEYADGSYNKDVQNAMINELTENTYMVAQTGIISMNNEYEGKNDNDPNILNGAEDPSTSLHRVSKTYENHESNVDLGLVERPRAQVKLTKNVSNMEIKLADGQTLFNANTSMKNLIYDDHSEHDITYKEPNKGPILEKVRVTLDSQGTPELIQAFMDDEIMDGATINITYHLQVENVGEIDYNDIDFYFYGKKSGDAQPVTTKVVRVIDYVPNDVSYDASKQNEDAHWDVYKPSELINSRITETANANNNVEDIVDGQSFADPVASTNNDNINRITARTATGDFYDKVNRDYVTRTYAHEVETYNTVVVTKDMNDELLPTLYVNDNSALEGRNVDNTTLILTTSITASGNSDDLTYNNLAEVIETANAYGRRMQFSISGNQEMANQDINDGGGTRTAQDHHAYSSSKIVQPREIDADSAQQVQILPPTGSPEYRNKLLTIITTTIATIIVLVGAIIIKKRVYDK